MRDVDALVHDLANKDRELRSKEQEFFKAKNEVASKEIDLKVAHRELEKISEKDKTID